jgi:hypothetical protein
MYICYTININVGLNAFCDRSLRISVRAGWVRNRCIYTIERKRGRSAQAGLGLALEPDVPGGGDVGPAARRRRTEQMSCGEVFPCIGLVARQEKRNTKISVRSFCNPTSPGGGTSDQAGSGRTSGPDVLEGEARRSRRAPRRRDSVRRTSGVAVKLQCCNFRQIGL